MLTHSHSNHTVHNNSTHSLTRCSLFAALEYPSCLHTVLASSELKPSLHTVPHCPLQYTSTRPSLVKLPPVSRTIPLYGLLQRRDVTSRKKRNIYIYIYIYMIYIKSCVSIKHSQQVIETSSCPLTQLEGM